MKALVLAHHLVVDGVSWRGLLPDLATAWLQLGTGQTPTLAPLKSVFIESWEQRAMARPIYWEPGQP